jgi:RNA polymerase sigma factor (sigma-70 family)
MRRTPPPDETCALRRSASEPQAFAAVYDAHAVGVLRFLARRTLDVEVARDLTAETFATAFRSRKRFRGHTDAEASGWIYGIARNLHSRYVRSGVVERRATERLGIRLGAIDEEDYERVVQLAGLVDQRARVAEAFEQLRPDQRAAVQLRIVDELPYEDVAARLAVSEPTARARVSRALRELATALDAHPNPRGTVS